MKHELIYNSETETPLGQLRLCGAISGGRGVFPRRPLRVYGRYAVVCVTRGRGVYEDAGGGRRDVSAGEAILVLPEWPHWYGPKAGQTWDEIYATFDGPVFDLWRRQGMLDISHPVRPYPDGFADRLRERLTEAARAEGSEGRFRQVNAFLLLLSELFPPGTTTNEERHDWAAEARALLATDLGREMDLTEVAHAVGMGYETFRKRFQQQVGVSPARYRAGLRIAAARELLRYTPQMTNRQVAETLGFADEFHFSRRFTEAVGISPREFRVRGGVSEEMIR